MTVLELPWPPSVNHYWRSVTKGRLAGRVLISEKGRKFRADVEAIVARHQIQTLTARLSVAIDVFPPDRRRRDIDNLSKSILDSLVHSGVIEDDSLIDRLLIERKPVTAPNGLVRVFIHQIEEGEVK